MLKYLKKPKPSLYPTGPMQIFDLLLLSRKEKECRLRCRAVMRELGMWKRAQKAGIASSCLYPDVEEILLRRRAQDVVMLYRIVRRDRIRAFRDYMEKLPARNNNFFVTK